jgi:hypothetical protein
MDENEQKPARSSRREIYVKPPTKKGGQRNEDNPNTGRELSPSDFPDDQWEGDVLLPVVEPPKPPDLQDAIKTLQDLGIAVSKPQIRPGKTGTPVQVRMSPELLKRLDAARGGHTRAQAIRSILERTLPKLPRGRTDP